MKNIDGFEEKLREMFLKELILNSNSFILILL